MTLDDVGGDAPCWAHLFDGDGDRRADVASRSDVEQLVRAFYRQVETDEVLGPVFAAAEVDWALHIPKLVDFWTWQLLGERGYVGNPLRAHQPVHARTPFAPEHYDRWLALFSSTIDGLFAGPIAETAKGRAQRMASALQRLLGGRSAPGGVAMQVMFARRGA